MTLSVARAPAAGSGALVVAARGERSHFEAVRADSPLRFLLPKPRGCTAAFACMTSLGGGLLRGDAIDVSVTVKPGATALVTTQASTKVFRGASRQRLSADVEGTLVYLPDPVACFADAEHASSIDVRLGDEGSVLVLDAFTAGRPAYGDRFRFARLVTRLRVWRGERLRVNDAIALDEDEGPIAARFGHAEAFATVIAMGPRAVAIARALLAPERPSAGAPPDAGVLYAPSPLANESGVIVRVVAPNSEALFTTLKRRLTGVADLCGIDPYAARW